MRSDMFKVIVERPRYGSRHAPAAKLKRTYDQNIKHIGLKRHTYIAADYSKDLNENLRPLIRFLRRQRGRPWDEVFSEICAHLDTGSTVKMHVRLHLEDFVMTPITIGRHGEWMCNGRVVGRPSPHYRRHRLFVDPNDGILRDIAELPARLLNSGIGQKGGKR